MHLPMIWGWQLLSYVGYTTVHTGVQFYKQPVKRFRTDYSQCNAIDHLLNSCTFDLSHYWLMPRGAECRNVYWIEMSFAATYRYTCSTHNRCNWNVRKIHLNSLLLISPFALQLGWKAIYCLWKKFQFSLSRQAYNIPTRSKQIFLYQTLVQCTSVAVVLAGTKVSFL